MVDQPRSPGFSTLAIHAGGRSELGASASALPPTGDSFPARFKEETRAAAYPGTPDADTDLSAGACAVLEDRIAALEGGTAAVAVGSGLAAPLIVFHTLMRPGDEFVASRKLHGRLVALFGQAFESFGWSVRWAEGERPETFAAACSDRTRAIFVGSIAESGGPITPIEPIAAFARERRVPLVVDNSVATPYLVRPLDHGADVVVHSITDFLCGHSQGPGGLIVDGGTFDWSADERFPAMSQPTGAALTDTYGNFAFAIACRTRGLRDMGQALPPSAAFQILAGLETLPLRMRRHCESAVAVASHLACHPAVHWVHYAGLPSDPGHELALRYAPRGAGAVFTFGVAGGREAALRVVRRLRLFSHLSAGGGDARSRVAHPASPARRGEDGEGPAGVGPDGIRLSIGLEDAEDLIADLDQALAV